MSSPTSLPLPALAAAAPLDHVEAATIVREVLQRVMRGELPGVPSAHVIRLSESGALNVEGPIAADGSDVRRAVHLLETLLSGPDSPRRIPGALRLIVARGLGTLDLPPYPSLATFADALSRFAAIDPRECFHRIVANRPGASVDEPAGEPMVDVLAITVSDIRRARRATGVSLSEIARRCDLPVHLLRQLEWGYLENWPPSHVGRRLIVSYARAAGLDERLVMEAVWPLLAESVLTRGSLALDESSAPRPVIVVELAEVSETTPGALVRIGPVVQRGSNMRRVVAALTIPALLAIGAAPAFWRSAARRDAQPPAPASEARTVEAPPRPAPRVPRETGVVIATPTTFAAPVKTGGVIVREPAPRPRQATAMKSRRSTPPAAASSRPSQARAKASRDKGPRKWGVWVLNKMGVRIVTTEEQ
jgi:hypothetical protein